MSDPRYPERDLKGFTILGRPRPPFVNHVYHLQAPDGTKWYSKVFTDLLNPKLKVYDGAAREVLAFRLGSMLGVPVPETYTWGHFGIMSKDAGDQFTVDPNACQAGPSLSEKQLKDLAQILVFSHWIRDHERSTEHLAIGGGRVWSFDYQNCGPGGVDDPHFVLQPWLEKKIKRANIEFDDVDRIGHFSGLDNPENSIRDSAVALQRLIRDGYPEILEHPDWLMAVVDQIEKVPSSAINKEFTNLRFFQRGGMDTRIDDIFKMQLRENQVRIGTIILQWIERASETRKQ